MTWPISSCRSCGAPIVFAKTAAGRLMPIDALEVSGFAVDVTTDPPTLIEQVKVHQSHFATCPNADQHRKKR